VRVCSLLPSATEIVYALGLGDQLVGVSHACDFPPEAATKSVLTRSAFDPSSLSSGQIDRAVLDRLGRGDGIYEIDLERLRRADPELVLTQQLCDVCAVPHADVVRALGRLDRAPAVLALSPVLLGDVLDDIRRVGSATGKAERAEGVAGGLQRRVDHVARVAARAVERPRTLCLEWADPLYVAGHWVPEMVEMAGGIDGLGTKGRPSVTVDWEAVCRFAPEVVILMPCGFDVERAAGELSLLARLPGWRDLPAVRRGRVYAVNATSYFSRSGPRLVDGLELLGKILHPGLFPGTPPPEAARQLWARKR
jgi:iron complex transport system substrate-binding protein